mmetsp:Transcript_45807/g.105796  ORF Transcript_45807/g.105796 Transcript_45807/m.105796 type:complete len:113 (-) Transcript_45807:192-530(-)
MDAYDALWDKETAHLPRLFPDMDRLFLVKGNDAGREAWYYVLVKNECMDDFKRCTGEKVIHLEEHGSILESGYGSSPPALVKAKIHRRFGISESEEPASGTADTPRSSAGYP